MATGTDVTTPSAPVVTPKREMAALKALDTDRPMIGTPQDAAKAKMAMMW